MFFMNCYMCNINHVSRRHTEVEKCTVNWPNYVWNSMQFHLVLFKMCSPWNRICLTSLSTGFITKGGWLTRGMVVVEGAVEAGHARSSFDDIDQGWDAWFSRYPRLHMLSLSKTSSVSGSSSHLTASDFSFKAPYSRSQSLRIW